jgi:hypothetical protein
MVIGGCLLIAGAFDRLSLLRRTGSAREDIEPLLLPDESINVLAHGFVFDCWRW